MAIRNVSVLILYNDKKEMLLQHRSKTAKRLPDYWGFFGGGIEANETPDQALARELLEELEYKVHKPTLIYEQNFTWNNDKNTKYVFIEKYDNNQKLIQHEGQEMRWVTSKILDNLQIVGHDLEIVSMAQKYLESIEP
jgi:8-oxo-dGTP diphosphatase